MYICVSRLKQEHTGTENITEANLFGSEKTAQC
jgi:hypothetical protein